MHCSAHSVKLFRFLVNHARIYLWFFLVREVAFSTKSCISVGKRLRFPMTLTRTPCSASLSFSSISRSNFSWANFRSSSTSGCGRLKFSILKKGSVNTLKFKTIHIFYTAKIKLLNILNRLFSNDPNLLKLLSSKSSIKNLWGRDGVFEPKLGN